MTVPMPGEMIHIKCIGGNGEYVNRKIEKVTILGANPPVEWKQEREALVITCPEKMELKSAVCFKIAFN